MTIGIIGAGICGLMAARELKRNGHDVWLLEKSRRVGGRMATQRVESENQNAVFDHGAQFFTSRNTEFSGLIDEMRQGQIAREWYRGYPSDEIKKDENYPRFCGTKGMTDVPKFLANALPIHLNETVQRITYHGAQWSVEANETYHADALILTPPVPQSLAFFKGDFALPDDAKNALQKINYEPSWAVLAQLDGASKIPFPGALHIENGPISWIADNYQKGISPLPGSVTIHARGDWTSQHFEDEPQKVTALLLNAARDYLGAKVISAQAHRWRYAKPLVTHAAPYLMIEKPASLFFAGDAFISAGAGPRVEGATLSGLAAARALCDILNTDDKGQL